MTKAQARDLVRKWPERAAKRLVELSKENEKLRAQVARLQKQLTLVFGHFEDKGYRPRRPRQTAVMRDCSREGRPKASAGHAAFAFSSPSVRRYPTAFFFSVVPSKSSGRCCTTAWVQVCTSTPRRVSCAARSRSAKLKSSFQ